MYCKISMLTARSAEIKHYCHYLLNVVVFTILQWSVWNSVIILYSRNEMAVGQD